MWTRMVKLTQFLIIVLFLQVNAKIFDGDSVRMLVITTTRGIFAYDFHSSKLVSLALQHHDYTATNFHGLALDIDGHRLLWSDRRREHEPGVYVSDLSHYPRQIPTQRIASLGLSEPFGLTFDPVTQNVYVADRGLSAIVACRTHLYTKSSVGGHAGSNIRDQFINHGDMMCVVLYNSSLVSRPSDVVLNQDTGILYWIEDTENPKIVSGHSDGPLPYGVSATAADKIDGDYGRPQVLASGMMGRIHSLALDVGLERLFWVDSIYDRIESVSLDGTERQIHQDVPHPSALAVFEDRLFWSHKDVAGISSSSISHSQDTQVAIADLEGVLSLEVFSKDATHKSISRDCKIPNCNGVCLDRRSRGIRCACPDGFTHSPANTGNVCKRNSISPTLLISSGTMLLSVPFNQFSPMVAQKLAELNAHALAHVHSSQSVVFSSPFKRDGHNQRSSIQIMSRANHTENNETPWRRETIISNAGVLKSLEVYDKAGLLYWLDSEQNSIEVASIDGKYRSRLDLDKKIKLGGFALDVQHGVLYLSDLTEPASIEICHQDGSNCDTLVSGQGIVHPAALRVASETLLWVDRVTHTICSVDLHSNVVTHHLKTAKMPLSVAAFQHKLIWTEAESGSVFYACTGGSCENVDNQTGTHNSVKPTTQVRLWIKSDVSHVLVIAENEEMDCPESADVVNRCYENNGGCDHLCLSSLDHVTCLCSDGYHLGSDYKTCQINENSELCGDVVCHSGTSCNKTGDEPICMCAKTLPSGECEPLESEKGEHPRLWLFVGIIGFIVPVSIVAVIGLLLYLKKKRGTSNILGGSIAYTNFKGIRGKDGDGVNLVHDDTFENSALEWHDEEGRDEIDDQVQA